MSSYLHQKDPVHIPVPGNKLIEEYLGRVSTNSSSMSVAHMVAPPGWSEPAQTPEFDEVTIMVRGSMTIRVDHNEEITLHTGEVFLAHAGTTVQYSNLGKDEAEYWAICTPAFSNELVNRD